MNGAIRRFKLRVSSSPRVRTIFRERPAELRQLPRKLRSVFLARPARDAQPHNRAAAFGEQRRLGPDLFEILVGQSVVLQRVQDVVEIFILPGAETMFLSVFLLSGGGVRFEGT